MNNEAPTLQQSTPNGSNGKGLSVAGLVCGIISAVLAWFYLINTVALICGIVGLVCASKGRKQAKAAGAPSGLGTAGLVISIVGTCLAGIGFLSCTLCVICAAGTVDGIDGALSSLTILF